MVKFDELNADNIKDMSTEDLQALALSWKDELMSARGVIWDLNKKIKKPESNDGSDSQGLTKEELDKYYDQKRNEENFKNFLSENSFDEDQKKQAEEYFAKGLSNEEIAKLTGVSSYASNQNNSNRMWVGGWDAGARSMFEGKLSYSDYSKLDKTGKDAYKSFSREKFGGLSFDRSQREDY